jgi:3-isopropylmalate/(R)-2-methylmalate dehydratase small subunit
MHRSAPQQPEGLCQPEPDANEISPAPRTRHQKIHPCAASLSSAIPRDVGKYEDLRADADSLLAMAGNAWAFGDFVSRRQVLADEHLEHSPDTARPFVMAALDADFARKVSPGDFLVAGLDFAADATHRIVPAAIKALGLAAVVARSFGRFFVRHATACGLPALVVEETGAIKTGDRLRVDIEAHIVANLSSGDRYVIRNIDDETLAILRAGGRPPGAPNGP